MRKDLLINSNLHEFDDLKEIINQNSLAFLDNLNLKTPFSITRSFTVKSAHWTLNYFTALTIITILVLCFFSLHLI